jgi:hypothetical protein
MLNVYVDISNFVRHATAGSTTDNCILALKRTETIDRHRDQ